MSLPNGRNSADTLPLLSLEQQAAVDCIAGHPRVWTPARKLARAGHSQLVLESLVERGWIVAWDRDRWGKPLSSASWCLTPWAASRLGLFVVEIGPRKLLWSREPDRAPIIARLARHEERLRFPELVLNGHSHSRRPTQWILSRYWNETTEDPAEAERILGAPVQIERPKTPQGHGRTRLGKSHALNGVEHSGNNARV